MDAYSVFLDLTLLLEVVNALEEEERGFDALYAGNDIINVLSRLDMKLRSHWEARRRFVEIGLFLNFDQHASMPNPGLFFDAARWSNIQ